jgi:hypothetical protein
MEKVRFSFFNEILERKEEETLAATAVDEARGIFQLKNIPYFMQGFAREDKVRAVEEDGMAIVKELVEKSGNSTINLVFLRGREKERVLQEIKELGAEWEDREKPVNGYYSLNIPQEVHYKPVQGLLNRERKAGVLDFREACLSHTS